MSTETASTCVVLCQSEVLYGHLNAFDNPGKIYDRDKGGEWSGINCPYNCPFL